MWSGDAATWSTLAADGYGPGPFWEAERRWLAREAWFPLVHDSDLRATGSFVTRRPLDRSVLAWNDGRQTAAYFNRCVHRHAQLQPAASGTASCHTCPYHGWRYGPSGRVTHVPDAESFAPMLQRMPSLRRPAQARLGPWLMAALEKDAAPRAWPGVTQRHLTEAFDGRWRPILREVIEHPCNWKIALENVLENYHVPLLHQSWLARHPEVFRLFGTGVEHHGPPPRGAGHTLAEGYTDYRDTMGGDSRLYGRLLRRWVDDDEPWYLHHHAFPNLVVGRTPIVSYLQCIVPTTATTSESWVWLFMREPPRGWVGVTARLGAHLAGAFMRQVLAEDAAIYPAVQAGSRGHAARALLSRREERIDAYQRWWSSAVGA